MSADFLYNPTSISAMLPKKLWRFHTTAQPCLLFLRLSTPGVCRVSENAECPFVSTSYLVVPGFFSNHLLFTRQTANLQVLGWEYLSSGCWEMPSMLRLILIVSPVRTFMKYCFVADVIRNKGISRISTNAECPFPSLLFQTFSFIFNIWAFSVPRVHIFDIECSALVSFSRLSYLNTTWTLWLIINRDSERVNLNLKLSIPSLAAQHHNTMEHPILTASKGERRNGRAYRITHPYLFLLPAHPEDQGSRFEL